MLATPVGSGKTYVALATVQAIGGPAPAVVVAPAVLVRQWRRVAAALGIPVEILSHEAVSRGRPPMGSGPVVIDEAHRFREPSAQRYRTIAPALVGRAVILVTATPIVNRVDDLIAQLLLAVRDDALAELGLPSIRELPGAPPALEAVVIRSGACEPDAAPQEQVPSRYPTTVSPPQDPTFTRLLRGIDGLRCAPTPAAGLAAVIRINLLRALGSSPAALGASLDRYRRLLDHAARARRAGHPVSRRAVLAAVGGDPEQLVLWELLPVAERAAADLVLTDRARLGSLRRLTDAWPARGDRKVELLEALIADRRPTIVFTTSVETVRYLRRRLAMPGVAWVTGSGAGLGPLRASRAAVLGAFDPSESWPPAMPRPWLLIASDVAAEGLNLQLVSRVVHYDLPWTAVRLAQRDGRAVRMGSRHHAVEVVTFQPPSALESRIALAEAIERKARLPAAVGLDRRAAPAISVVETGAPPAPGWVVLRTGRDEGVLAALTAGRASLLLRRHGSGPWQRIGAEIGELLARCQEAFESDGTERTVSVERIIAELRPAVEDWLTELSLAAAGFSAAAAPRRASRRAAVLATAGRGVDLWRQRRASELEEIGRLQRFLTRGHSAGEAALARSVARDEPAAVTRAAALEDGISAESTATLVGLVVFLPSHD
jgi:hypothetical protein